MGKTGIDFFELRSSYANGTMLTYKWYGTIDANKSTRTINGAKVVAMSGARRTLAVAA